MTTTTAPTTRPPRALTFDERLALAPLAIDARIATTPLDLADVIRLPVDTRPPAAPGPYRTPLAALLHRAAVRIETDGWATGACRDEDGRRCLVGAIRAEASSRRLADDACTLLLDVIRREFGGADDTVPSWNDRQTSPRPVLLALGRAAQLASDRNR
ncbi:DUF6197 family protein [Streptomyces cyanogenus]|uniref:Uncharacterized protein n=1 Tax=Streptomyces cyanogenus TaxID=80860 RepID=A0ABX7TNH7_STRCY|nr:hypothetical protein [Streptomyces cyanogenus]QTD96991.1 hypothetical protein S1361_06480 [Streptomyces cyanogenus]